MKISCRVYLSDDERKSTFTFDEDGWGNSGSGELIFYEDKIELSFDIWGTPEGLWGVFEKTDIYIREQL